jgi:hypothetical protein
LHSSFRGGFIFPLFYIGVAVGLEISLGFPQIYPTITMVCLMAAVNVTITKPRQHNRDSERDCRYFHGAPDCQLYQLLTHHPGIADPNTAPLFIAKFW